MADNPYSPFVDRTSGSTSWGANPLDKRGPQYFPPLPTFKPYPASASSSSSMPMIQAAISRLRTTPVSPSGAGVGSGASGRGLSDSGMAVQGIAGIQGIPTLGSVAPDLNVAPPATPPPTDTPVSPDAQDQPTPDTTQPTGDGTVTGADLIAKMRATDQARGGTGPTKRRLGPQY
jgi:hypothetical protein